MFQIGLGEKKHTECNNKNHSATFPEKLPEWFIKLFTDEEDWVLDPFTGSGTTNKVAQRLRRNSIGIEILPEYYEMVNSHFNKSELYICEDKKQSQYEKVENQ